MLQPGLLQVAVPAARCVVLSLALIPIVALAQQPTIDAKTPLEQLKISSAEGSADAMLELGERLIQGRGATANTTEGIAWIQKAADAGKHQGWYELGVVYANGMGVQMDMQKAMGFFRKGADLGNSDSQCSLGMFYQAGEKIPGGVKADPAEARRWYRMAAEQNHQEAIFHLGQLMMFGQGGDADPVEAAAWFRKGSELGNPEAQWSLGQCYFEGKGVKKDLVQAYALYAAAAEGVENPDQKKGMGERRDKLGKELTQEQLKEAAPLIKAWTAERK
jgi:TPR repeat protein